LFFVFRGYQTDDDARPRTSHHVSAEVHVRGYQTVANDRGLVVSNHVSAEVYDLMDEELWHNVERSDPLLSSVADSTPLPLEAISPTFYSINPLTDPLHPNKFPRPELAEDLDLVFGSLPE
jgi:hypothetical protein